MNRLQFKCLDAIRMSTSLDFEHDASDGRIEPWTTSYTRAYEWAQLMADAVYKNNKGNMTTLLERWTADADFARRRRAGQRMLAAKGVSK